MNRLLWSAAILLLIAVLLLSLAVGRVWLPPTMLLGGLFTPEPNLGGLIVIELRAPRTLLGLMVGATLGLSGAVLQGLLRNPFTSALPACFRWRRLFSASSARWSRVSSPSPLGAAARSP